LRNYCHLQDPAPVFLPEDEPDDDGGDGENEQEQLTQLKVQPADIQVHTRQPCALKIVLTNIRGNLAHENANK
jgi:hypothetical protein